MPRKRRGKRKGAGIDDIFKKVNKVLKSTAISKGANLLGISGNPYASQVGAIASSLGYGRRKRYAVEKGHINFLYQYYNAKTKTWRCIHCYTWWTGN